MQKATWLLFLIGACAVDVGSEDGSSTQAAAEGCDGECSCENECPPPPPPNGPSCTDAGVLVVLDDAPANLDDEDGKVTYCHATSSATNPFVVITTSVNACFAHETHVHQVTGGHLDVFPTGGCAD